MDKDFFERGVAEIIDESSLKSKLKSDKKLRIKFGVDPTRPDIHLGHAVALRKLQELQKAGHTIIFLIGDYTTKIGDPSGRNTTRPVLSDDEIKSNAKTYFDQVGRILDVNKTEIRYNSEWFDKMDFNDILQLAGKFTVAQIIERDDFEKRLKERNDIGLHETLYPLMQAYDSVALNADVEFGGTDQKFNLLAGRDLQKKMGQMPQDIMMMRLLVGTDGKIKMSKSADNYISITEPVNQMFGKIMSIPDSIIFEYFELCTDITLTQIDKYKQEIKDGKNPRDIKLILASDICEIYHGKKAAETAKEEFINVFSKKELPTDIPEIKIESKNIDIKTLLQLCDNSISNSDIKRLVEQGAVRIDGTKIINAGEVIGIPEKGVILEVGKRKVYRVKP